MKKIVYFLLLSFISIEVLYCNQRYTVSGYIKDETSGEELIGATVYVRNISKGTVANTYGFYSVTLPEGNYTIEYSCIGYDKETKKIHLTGNQNIDVELKAATMALDEVVVTAEKQDGNIYTTELGTEKFSMKQISSVPVLFGEQDILKTIQLKAGVSSSGEGNSGFNVRGGSPDQNLILLDEAPVYNASHLLGFFSIFNADAIKDVKLIKGSMPANYGGRVSSVLDVKMNEGNSKQYSTSIGLGLISSHLTIEGPIVKEKSSFIVSGRRTYADLFLKLLSDEQQKNTGLYFYDLNLKTNYRMNDKHRIYLSGYFGRDVFNFNDNIGFSWGNYTLTLRWNHLINRKLFINRSLIYSNYDYEFNLNPGSRNVDITSRIEDINYKEDYHFYLNPGNTIKFGFNVMYHTFHPGEIKLTDDATSSDILMQKKHAFETGIFAMNEQKVSDNLIVSYGLRHSSFTDVGPGNDYAYNEEGRVIDTNQYSKSDIIKSYDGFEPRLSINGVLNDRSSIKVGYARNYQYMHLLQKNTSASPTDLWVPSSSYVKPQIADQISAGYYRNFKDNSFISSVEVYYKNLQNQTEYRNGADLMMNELIESQLVFGKGRAYGVEFQIEKTNGDFTGWISYTLAKSERSFDAIKNGDWFPATQDRTHDLSVIGMYKLSDRITLSGTWVYYTGNAVTFPSAKYQYQDFTVNYYTERNGYRMPDYHRLDLGLTIEGKKTKKSESSWNFSIYNVYARENAYSIDFRQSESNPDITEAVQLSLFSIVPSITYHFKF